MTPRIDNQDGRRGPSAAGTIAWAASRAGVTLPVRLRDNAAHLMLPYL